MPHPLHPQEGFERRADPGDPQQQELLSEMRSHIKKVGHVQQDAVSGMNKACEVTFVGGLESGGMDAPTKGGLWVRGSSTGTTARLLRVGGEASAVTAHPSLETAAL